MNKKVIIGVSIAGALALGALAYFKLLPHLTPLQKFTLDAFNPATTAGAEIKNYLGTRYSTDTVNDVIRNHSSQGSASHIYRAYLVQSKWKASDVVTY